MLAEIVIDVIAPAIAKLLFRMWVKDADIASDVASDLTVLIGRKTKDMIAQRRMEREFAEIGARVAEVLITLFERDGVSLPENAQTAVAYAVADTIGKAPLTSELLVKQDLEPMVLAKYLKEINPSATVGFSSDESTLFRRGIEEISNIVVDIATRFPHFTEASFAEILKRQRDLLAKADETLAKVSAIMATSWRENSEANAARFESEYCLALVRKFDRMELFGVDVSQQLAEHSLSIGYVTLSAVRSSQTVSQNDEIDQLNEEQVGLRIDEILAGAQRLFIRGQAGCGKTTLLKWIAVRAASHSFPSALDGWNNKIPFVILLRQFTDQDLPTPKEFPRLIAPAINDIMPETWVFDQLNSGRAIVLVDGVDETSRRHETRDWLTNLVQTFPSSVFIITSRPSAVAEDWLDFLDFAHTELLPMDLGDVFHFVDHWHDAVKSESQGAEENQELDELSEAFKAVIQTNQSIRNLATNPLLCAMLCALHKERNRQLPQDRVALYEAALMMLLDRRDSERKVDLSSYPALTYNDKRGILAELAYDLMHNGWSEIEIPRVEERLETILRSIGGIALKAGPKRVLKYLIDRSGVIRSPTDGHIDFMHRTFQEYLTAVQIIYNDDIGYLLGRADDDQWKEVIVLSFGVSTSKKQRREILYQLIQQGDQHPELRHQRHILAVECLQTSQRVEEDLRDEISKRLAFLEKPRTVSDAMAWASAGDLAIPYLVSKDGDDALTSSWSIRALATIGGDAALQAISGYRKDKRQTVTNELLRAAVYFPPDKYRYLVSKDISALSIGHPSMLRLLSAVDYPNLAYITVKRLETEYGDFLPILSSFPSISRLKLESCNEMFPGTSDIPIEELHTSFAMNFGLANNIKSLQFKLCNVPYGHFMLLTPNIQSLTFENCHNMGGRAFLSIEQLQFLDALTFWNSNMERLPSLANMSSLGSLALVDCRKLFNIDALRDAHSLKILRVNSTWGLSQLERSIFQMLPSLEQFVDVTGRTHHRVQQSS